jgi:hypothetical protein
MEEEYELFVDFVRLLTEDELLTVTPLRSRLGGPTSDTGEEYSREISAVVALDMTREGATLAREVIVETLDALGVNYTETLPGLWTLRLRRPRTSGLSPNCSKTRRWTLRITGDGPAALAPCIWGHLA